MTWNDVNFEDDVVHIRAKDGWQPKTGDEWIVHLSAVLRQVLAQLPQNSQLVFTAPRADRYPAVDRQVSDRQALAHLKTVLKRLGLSGHLHTFRHRFISYFLTSGVPEAMVRDWVGHVDAEIFRVYTHIADKQSRRAMDEILPGKSVAKGAAGDQE